MTYRVGPKGQVVIPKAIRDELDIRPGDEVEVERHDHDVCIRRVEPARLLGRWAQTGVGSADVEREHRDELARDDAKTRRLGG